MATNSRSPVPRSRTDSGPPTRISAGSRQSCPARRRDPADRYRRHRRGPLLHAFGSATPEPEVRRTAMRAPPRRLAHDAPHDALLRSQDAPTRRARCRPAARAADLRDPVPGNGREEESAAGFPERAKEPRGPPLRSGSHDLDGWPPTRRRPDIRMAERVRFRRRTQRREHADRAPEQGPLHRDISHVVVRRAVLPMSRVALPRDDDHPQIRNRGEHARPRSHDDVVSPCQDLQPPPISSSPVSPDQQPHTLPERVDDRRRGRRNRSRLGHQDDRAPPTGQTASNDLDGRRDLVLRCRPKDERTGPAGDGRRKRGAVPVRREEVGGRGRSAVGGGGRAERGMGWLGKRSAAPAATPTRVSPQQPLLGRDPGRRPTPDHRGQRSDVPLAHPPHQLEHRFVEEPDGRHDLLHVQRPRPEHLGGPQHPPPDQPAVERDPHERADAPFEIAGKQIRERAVEAEDGAVDADGDGAVEDEAALHVVPRPAS